MLTTTGRLTPIACEPVTPLTVVALTIANEVTAVPPTLALVHPVESLTVIVTAVPPE